MTFDNIQIEEDKPDGTFHITGTETGTGELTSILIQPDRSRFNASYAFYRLYDPASGF